MKKGLLKTKMVMILKKMRKSLVLNEEQVVKNKIPNEKILYLALNLGLLPVDEFETLKSIGQSKHVNDLMHDLSISDHDAIIDRLQRLWKARLIEIS
jgi:hypothetical protein